MRIDPSNRIRAVPERLIDLIRKPVDNGGLKLTGNHQRPAPASVEVRGGLSNPVPRGCIEAANGIRVRAGGAQFREERPGNGGNGIAARGQAMIRTASGHRWRRLRRIEAVHGTLRYGRMAAAGELPGVGEATGHAVEEIRIQGNDHIRIGNSVDGKRMVGLGGFSAIRCLLSPRRFIPMPTRFWKLVQQFPDSSEH